MSSLDSSSGTEAVGKGTTCGTTFGVGFFLTGAALGLLSTIPNKLGGMLVCLTSAIPAQGCFGGETSSNVHFLLFFRWVNRINSLVNTDLSSSQVSFLITTRVAVSKSSVDDMKNATGSSCSSITSISTSSFSSKNPFSSFH